MIHFLERFLARNRLTCLWVGLCILSLLPAKILFDSYSSGAGFLRTIHFSHRLVRQLDPEIQDMVGGVSRRFGYDGQFYAAMALCPDLRCEGMGYRADAPGYRFRRMGLPAMAWVMGWGDPSWVLHVYSVINVFFWFGLWIILFRYTGFRGLRDHLLAISLLWSAGTLLSLERALTDLPAVVLTVWVSIGLLGRLGGIGGMAMALLVKETSLLSVPTVFQGSGWSKWVRQRTNWWTGIVILLPLLLWLAWVEHLFPLAEAAGKDNFSWPMLGIWEGAVDAWTWRGRSLLHERIHLFLTLTALASLGLQAVYLLWKRRPEDSFWRMGVAFGILFLCLGSNVMEDYNAYLRVVLPLTFAFNLLIHRHEQGEPYLWLFLGGNLGMMGVAVNEWLGFMGHALV